MAGYRYLDLITEVETIANVTGQRAMVQRLVNAGVAAIGAALDWPWLWTESFFTTVAVYNTGTASVTSGSASVTGSSTVWTSAMVGRKFRRGTESAYYYISAVPSATSLTLQQPYQGTTASAQTYSIFKDIFRLAANVDKQKLIRQIQFGVALFPKHVSEFDTSIPTPQGTGPAFWEMLLGKDERSGINTYTTGTVSANAGSRILTGSSTVWTGVEGLTRGTKIQQGGNLYTANVIDSDTQITVYEAFGSAIPAASTYTILLDNLLVQLYTIPNVVENYYYRYQRIPAVLDANGDYPDMPAPLHPLIIKWAMPWMWEHKGMIDRATYARRSYAEDLVLAIKHYASQHQDRLYRRLPRDISFGGNRTAGYPSNVGIPISSP